MTHQPGIPIWQRAILLELFEVCGPVRLLLPIAHGHFDYY
jgi:hypothetical protein